LQNLQQNNLIPWCSMGDFNSILGAFVHIGHYSPRIPMKDFQLWTDRNSLIHIPIKGAAFTW